MILINSLKTICNYMSSSVYYRSRLCTTSTHHFHQGHTGHLEQWRQGPETVASTRRSLREPHPVQGQPPWVESSAVPWLMVSLNNINWSICFKNFFIRMTFWVVQLESIKKLILLRNIHPDERSFVLLYL